MKFKLLIFYSLFSILSNAQNLTFKIVNRDITSSTVPNNALFFQVPIANTNIQKDFDVINLTNVNQEIIVKKTEVILNKISNNDVAKPSYCFGINCHGPEVFTDTVTFLPNQGVSLEIDFVEATQPGHSLIMYSVINKNNSSQISSLYMDYKGVVGIFENTNQNSIQIFPNPITEQLYLANLNSIEKTHVEIFDLMGSKVFESTINSGEALMAINLNLPNGYYNLKINSTLNKKIVVQKD